MSTRKNATRSKGKSAQQARAESRAKKNSSAIAAAFAAALAVLAAALLVGSGGGEEGGTKAAPAGMAHVHGLAVDPADGTLLAGTHHGTFRISEDGEAEQFGPVQDFMGFSVAGPGEYLASGHPGEGQDGPHNLGLIESVDSGKTWQTVSLAGEADFHTLEARHGNVYGVTGGQLLVSEDKETWDQRSSIPIIDLAVSPADPDLLVATTQQGLGVSSDGGRQFQALPGAPGLLLLSWTEEGELVGVDPEGSIHTSSDEGTTWTERGSIGGEPGALTADGERVYAATRDGRIVQSDDSGSTFKERYTPS